MNYLIDTLYDLSQKSGRPAQEGGPFNADPTAVPPGPGRTGYDSNLRAEAIRTDYWNWGRGFISAYPPDQFIMLEQGATYGTQNTQIWAPYYTLHKILAGLLDCYEVGGNQKALEIAKDMGAWVYARLKVLPTETRISMWNRYIAGEYGGMNEVMARLYRLTGDRQFLECAKLFDNINFFFGNAEHEHGLAKNVDTIRGKHANQHIPQITGALETYRDTRELPYYRIADNFWHIVTSSYMYSIGGVAGARNPNNAECFTAEPDTLCENGFADGGQNETCATYNLLKLDRQLFMFDPDRQVHGPLRAGPLQPHPGLRGRERSGQHLPRPAQSRRAEAVRQRRHERLHLLQRHGPRKQHQAPGLHLLQGRRQQDALRQPLRAVHADLDGARSWSSGSGPISPTPTPPGSILEGGGRFDIKVRVPRWATRGFFVKINGRTQSVKAVPGTYLTLSRNWRDNDTIELRMPFRFYLDPVVDQPNVASLFYGPVLLAAEESGPRTDWRPVTLDAGDIGKSITGDPGTLRFSIGDVGLQAVLRDLRAPFGVSGRDAKVRWRNGREAEQARFPGDHGLGGSGLGGVDAAGPERAGGAKHTRRGGGRRQNDPLQEGGARALRLRRRHPAPEPLAAPGLGRPRFLPGSLQ